MQIAFIINPIIIYIFYFRITRFTSILCRFLFFSILPNSYIFIQTFNVERLPNEPFISRTIFLSIEQLDNFILVIAKSQIYCPSEIFCHNRYSVQGYFNTRITCLTYILPSKFIPCIDRQIAFHQ